MFSRLAYCLRILPRTFFVLGLLGGSHTCLAQDKEEVNFYTTREPGLIRPILDSFYKDTGIKVNSIFLKNGLTERVSAEGDRSPADLLMVVDAGRLIELSERGLTQPVESKKISSAVPKHLRAVDGRWVVLSLRARVLYADKNLPIEAFHYQSLADPKWRNKVCIRSGQHPYNIALFSAMIAHHGTEQTTKWLRGVKQNLARKAAGGDRDVARDILGGICDIGIANSYYIGKMKQAKEGSKMRQWGDGVKVILPTFGPEGGTHVNVSGAAVARYAPNRENAIRLLEYLVSPQAQAYYAKVNFEYPVRPGVEADPITASLGTLKIDNLNVAQIAKHREEASTLVNQIGFDQ